ncbi:MAG TPA: hypothetical protein VLF21_03745 [Candidatus Saccharimonadales bacterium]|nr:hypothetical protein [Candidatus Saccharimonadales bacterium]
MPATLNSQRLAVIAGTTVPEGIGPLSAHLPLLDDLRLLPHLGSAGLLYRQFAQLAVTSRVYGLHRLGFAHTEESYQRLKPRLLRFAGGQMIDLIGDSQGGLVAVRFASEFPHLVGHLVLLSTPLDGAPAAYVVDTPGTRCMRPGSRYIQRIRAELAEILELPNGPSVWCVSSGHDYLVPHHSAGFDHPSMRGPQKRNLCLAHDGHQLLHDMWELVPVADGRYRNHITEVFLRHTGRAIATILAQPSREQVVVKRFRRRAA